MSFLHHQQLLPFRSAGRTVRWRASGMSRRSRNSSSSANVPLAHFQSFIADRLTPASANRFRTRATVSTVARWCPPAPQARHPDTSPAEIRAAPSGANTARWLATPSVTVPRSNSVGVLRPRLAASTSSRMRTARHRKTSAMRSQFHLALHAIGTSARSTRPSFWICWLSEAGRRGIARRRGRNCPCAPRPRRSEAVVFP